MNPTLELLRSVSRFAGLAEPDLIAVKNAARIFYCAKSKQVFAERQQADALYVIVTGYVKVFKNFEIPRILHIFGPGESIGEMALLRAGAFPASAVTLTSGEILTLSRSVYQRLATSSLAFSGEVAKTLANRPVFLTEAVANFNDGKLSERLKRAFTNLFARFGTEQGEMIEMPFYLTRQEIASLVDARQETVSRELNRWEKAGWLVTSQKGFVANKKFLSDHSVP